MERKMGEIFLWIALGWILGMATALFIGWFAERQLRKDRDDDADLWI